MTIDVELQRQAVFDEGRRQKVKIRQKVFAVIDLGPRADARAVIEQIQQG